jgi:hypothetical protein
MQINEADYWHVNSYSYPNPFSPNDKARQAWETLISFYDFSSYTELKRYWASSSAPRSINPHTVESWKTTFEEFGLLYVLTGTGEIHITPAGHQFRTAADAGRQREFAWIGLSLLLRYPLKGPRRPKGPRHADSNLLLYWFLFAAMRELQNYMWWSELERVLCKVFLVAEAEQAVETIRQLRAGQVRLENFPPPATRTSNFYNMLNQVVVHAGLNYLLLGRSADETFYDAAKSDRRYWILNDWLSIIDLALGGSARDLDCNPGTQFLSRMPVAPDFAGDEHAYFEYLGAEVPLHYAEEQPARMPHIPLQGGTVAILRHGTHYTASNSTTITGSIQTLCTLARNQRVILSHDLRRTYMIEEKMRIAPDAIQVRVRPARRITDVQAIQAILGGMSD